jgi:hypothetical protein
MHKKNENRQDVRREDWQFFFLIERKTLDQIPLSSQTYFHSFAVGKFLAQNELPASETSI